MIEFLKNKDFNQVIILWNRVFEDSKEDILNYLNNFSDHVIVFKEGEQVLGMTSLLPIKNGRYVYAVCVHPDFRNRKIAASMLDFSKEYIQKTGEDFLLLVPAEKSLFKFYEKHDFSPIYCTKTITVPSSSLLTGGLPAKNIGVDELYTLRQNAFCQKNFIEWDKKTLNVIYNMYNKGFYKVDDGFCVCTKINDTVYVKELYSDNIVQSLSQLHSNFNAKEYVVTLPEKSDIPNAMIYGNYPKNIYFNLAMD